MTIQEVYDKYKCFDKFLTFFILDETSPKDQVLFDLWQAIKKEVER